MPRVKCPKCAQFENIHKAGIVRNKQRYNCKNCNYHFIQDKKKTKNSSEPSRNDKQTSMQDIAQAAGVSIATVSRALKNKSDINRETSKLIKELANSMNYQPNILAQSLVTRSTHTLGVIIPSLETTIFSTMLSGIQEVAATAGYRVIICTSNEKHEREVANIQALMNNMIDGLLICHSIQTKTFEHLRIHLGKRIPIIQFYRVAVGLPISQILANDESGAEVVTEYLLKKGCKKIAVLLGPKELSLTQNRLQGYLNMLRKYKIKFDPKLLAHVDFSQESVIRSVNNWLEQFPELDAVISISDKSAAQIITYLKNKKIKIPQKIRVVGFGNEFVGEMLAPKLTTYDTQTRIIGEEASRLILEQIISGSRDITTKTVPGHLIIRESA